MTPKSRPGSVLGFAVLCLLLAATAHAEAPDLNRPIRWSIPAGNIWTTMEMYRAAAGALVRVRCNYCSGTQPCSSADLTSGGCVPQCPGPDQPEKVVSRACSLPCNALYSITTQAIEGEYQLFDALEHMLEGTGVTFALLTRSDTNSVEVILLDARRHFDIPAGPTTQTTMEFTRQSGVRLLLNSELYRRAQTSAVKGYLTPEEALGRMLQGTTLVYHRIRNIDDGVFVSEDPSQQVLIVGTRPLTGMETLTAAQVQTLDQWELKATDFGTVQDVIRQMPVAELGELAENFERSENLARGAAVNLRGLGPGATLVLVNGRRQPSSGIDGNFVDVSTIPWAGVARIDVLPDGASATYGTGAIGGVVNIIMRKDSDGAESRLRDAQVEGGATERVASQLLAGSWASGSALIAYQFSKREALAYSARGYARNADKRPYGGTDYRSTASNPGTILDPNTLLPAYAIPNGQNGVALDFKDLIPGANYSNYVTTADLVPDRRSHSGYLSLSQHLGDRWTLDGDVRFHARKSRSSEFAETRLIAVPSSNAYFPSSLSSPFILVNYSFSEDLGARTLATDVWTYSGGVTLSGTLTERWRTSVTASHGEERLRSIKHNLVDDTALDKALIDTNPTTAFNPFGAGSNTNPATLDKLRAVWLQQSTSSIAEFTANVDGTLASSRHGSFTLSVGSGIRRERLKKSELFGSFPSASHPGRDSRGLSAELTAPLAHNLSLSLAARIERFAARDTKSPKVALRWAPTESMHVRGTWGRAYRQPDLIDMSTAESSIGIGLIPDPKSATGRSLAILRTGSNSQLREETAKSWTAGLDLTSRDTRSTLSLTYFSIDYKDRVILPGAIPTIWTLQRENEWSNIVERNPSPQLLDELCSAPRFFGSRTECMTSATVFIDARLRNGGTTQLRGVDWMLEQPINIRYGQMTLNSTGTHLFGFKTSNGSVLPASDVRATTGNPPRTRLRGSINWYQHSPDKPGLSAGVAVSHVSAFQDHPTAATVTRMSPSTEVDLNLIYRSDDSGWLEGTELILNVLNIGNDPPPFLDTLVGYDASNATPYGRVVAFSVQKRF